MRVLVADADDRTAGYLSRGLSESGHIVDRVDDAETALAMATEGFYEVIVLDRKLPGAGGLALLRRLRQRDGHTPVLMLGETVNAADRAEGLRAGCDDYLGKPFSFSELLARLEALARRANRSRRRAVLRVRDLELDTIRRTVSRAGRVIDLQRREFLLLEHLLRHAGQIVSRSMLIESAWTYDAEARGNVVEMHIHRLRQKIDDGFADRFIRTVPGAGYTVDTADSPPPLLPAN